MTSAGNVEYVEYIEGIDIDIDIDPDPESVWDEITKVNPARYVVAQAQSELALKWMREHPEVKTFGEAVNAVLKVVR